MTLNKKNYIIEEVVVRSDFNRMDLNLLYLKFYIWKKWTVTYHMIFIHLYYKYLLQKRSFGHRSYCPK